MFICKDPDIGRRAQEAATKDGTDKLKLSVQLSSPVYAKDMNGEEHLVLEVHIQADTVRRRSDLPMKTFSWKQAVATYGEGETMIGRATLTAVRGPDGG